MPKRTAPKSRRVKKQRSKNKSWRGLKLSGKFRRLLRLVFISVSAVFISTLLLGAFTFYRFVRSPLASGYADNGPLNRNLFTMSFVVLEDGEDQAAKVSKLAFLAFDIQNSRLFVFNVPVWVEMDLPERFDYGTISKAYALGELNGEGEGVGLVNRTLEKIFARRLDRYILTDEEGLGIAENLLSVTEVSDISKLASLSNFARVAKDFASFKEAYETDLRIEELSQAALFLRSLSDERIEVREIAETDISNPYDLDLALSEIFTDPDIVDERKRVVVLNGSEVPGLGTFVSRYLENLGIKVSDVSNASKTFDESVIFARESSLTLDSTLRQVGIKKVVYSEDEIPGERAPASSDIVIIIGFDYANLL